jgi:hypothetical protein
MPTPPDPADDLAQLWAWFASTGCRGYSPLYERIATSVAQDAELLALVREAPPDAHLPHMLLAAVHDLVLGGLDHPLAAVYRGESDADPAPLFRDLCLTNRAKIVDVMARHHVQTNEVGRCAVIGPALTWVAGRHPGPIHLVDVGTSAGLNLICDRYRLDYGDAGATGDPAADVRVECRIAGGSPPIADRLPLIGRRIGLDREPIDVTDRDAARWLLACTWPDTDRLPRTARAIAVARDDPPELVTGDAVTALPATLATLPGDGVVCVLTTWSFSYLPVDARPRFVEVLADAGRRRPVVWIAADGVGTLDHVEAGPLPDHGGGDPSVLVALELVGERPRPTTLASVHAHGVWMDWRA